MNGQQAKLWVASVGVGWWKSQVIALGDWEPVAMQVGCANLLKLGRWLPPAGR